MIQDPKGLKKDRQKVEDKWKVLTKQATIKNPNFKEPIGIFFNSFSVVLYTKLIVPYTENHIVGQHNGLNNGNIFLI